MKVVSTTIIHGFSTATAVLLLAALVNPVYAQEGPSIYYGSRTGMHVTIVSKSGVGTSRAVIMIKHTPKDAKAFCVDYNEDFSAACVQRTMADVKIRDRVTGNCKNKTWTDVYGQVYAIEGKAASSDMMRNYLVRNLDSGEILDGSMASGYFTALSAFQELCPGITK